MAGAELTNRTRVRGSATGVFVFRLRGHAQSVRRALEGTSKEVAKMKLLTKEIRRKLPPLYSQEQLGGKAVAYLKLFTPAGSWTF